VISRGSNPCGVIVISSDSKSAIGRILCGKGEAGTVFTTSGKVGGGVVDVRRAAITPPRAPSKSNAPATIDTTIRVRRGFESFLIDMKVSPGKTD
jgi:hypothetical protein